MSVKYKYFMSGCLILMMLLSCDESFLEITPIGSVSEETLTSELGLNKLLVGAYGSMNNSGTPGAGAQGSDAYIFGCDENRQGTTTGVSLYDAFLWEPNLNYIHMKWRFQYNAIARANEILKILPKVTDSTPEKLLQIEAQAKFIRAVFYLRLAMYFKNVCWIDETINYNDKNFLVPNNADIYPKIEADFKFAADNLPEIQTEVGRANKWAAKAFLAKTYLWQQKFSEAKTLLDDIIANGQTPNGKKYALLAKYNDNFITETKHGSEGVYVMQNSVKDGEPTDQLGNPTDKYGGTYGAPANAGGAGWMQPTFDLVDAFQTDPETGLPLLDTYYQTPVANDNGLLSSQPFTPHQGTLDPRLDWCVGRRGIPYRDWGIHPGAAWIRNQRNGGPYCAIKNTATKARMDTDQGRYGATNNPYNIIRFAEVLLWAAECEIEVGSLAKAEEYVNMIRARAANPEGFVKTYIDPSDPLKGFTDTPAANYKIGLYTGQFAANGKSYARKAVFFERRLELAMEHHRFFDLVRYDHADASFDIAEQMNWFLQHEGKRISNPVNNYLFGHFDKGVNEILPIPQPQIDLSVGPDGVSVLVQNPGYL